MVAGRNPLGNLMKIALSIAIATLVAASLPAHAGNKVSAAECRAWFSRLDKNGDGSLGKTENATMYFNRITLATPTKGSGDDHIMKQAFFLAECAVGSFGRP